MIHRRIAARIMAPNVVVKAGARGDFDEAQDRFRPSVPPKVRPVAERATPTSELNAAFTASFVGNILESSGANKTRLLPFLNS